MSNQSVSLGDLEVTEEELQQFMANFLIEKGATEEKENELAASELIEQFSFKGWDVTTEQLVKAANRNNAISYDINVREEEKGELLYHFIGPYDTLSYRDVNYVDEVDERFEFFAREKSFSDLVPLKMERKSKKWIKLRDFKFLGRITWLKFVNLLSRSSNK